MHNSLMRWHLARDNQVKLAKFCEKHAVQHDSVEPYQVDDKRYFQHKYIFDNGSWIQAEMRAGDTKSYSIADHFQVVAYETA